jgi:hypothetical protein
MRVALMGAGGARNVPEVFVFCLRNQCAQLCHSKAGKSYGGAVGGTRVNANSISSKQRIVYESGRSRKKRCENPSGALRDCSLVGNTAPVGTVEPTSTW